MQPEAVTLSYRGLTFEVGQGGRLADCLAEAGLAGRPLLAVRDGRLITETEVLLPGDGAQLLDEISGGGA